MPVEIVAVLWPHIAPVGDAGRLFVPRSKTDTEGAGAYAFFVGADHDGAGGLARANGQRRRSVSSPPPRPAQ